MQIVHKKNDFGKLGFRVAWFIEAWILLYSGQYDTFNHVSGREHTV